MNIAFYAPLKPPDHSVPSGDRLMARLLIRALEMAGHAVDVISRLRSYSAEPAPLPDARDEISRIGAAWRAGAKPDLWFCYHPYYKAPDLLGPPLCRAFGVAYATAEASYAGKRDHGAWASNQALVVDAIRLARVNFSFTERDREGLLRIADARSSILFPPFIDTAPFQPATGNGDGTRLACIAMMRAGDKFKSYRFLAQALAALGDRPWHLTVIGHGPLRVEVTALYPPKHADFLGEKLHDEIPRLLAANHIYAWPGCGEAYGLAYLEAQAAGLPVVAQRTAGVPAVVRHGETGILSPEGDVMAFAQALGSLIENSGERRRLAAGARRFVHEERSLAAASIRLAAILAQALKTS